jgi:parallel beta-helix repeat protein
MGEHQRSRDNRTNLRLVLFFTVALLLLCATSQQPLVSSIPSRRSAQSSRLSPLSDGQFSLRKSSPGPVHNPIVIASDADFSSQGWPGSGTPGNPYRIQNYSIEATLPGQSCIDISNTAAHFVISQCMLTRSGLETNTSGITLRNVRNGRLDNNTFVSGIYGVLIQNSSANTVVGNIFSGQATGVVVLEWSNSSIVEKNTVLSSVDGISLWHSSLCQLISNNCTSSHYAISLEESESNVVYNNTCIGALSAIRVESSSRNNTLTNNTCVECHLGIGLSWSDSNKAIRNWCVNSTGGIGLEGSDFSLVANNTLTNLSGGGIEAVESDNCAVTNNTLTSVAGGGIEVSASTNCTLRGNRLSGTQQGIYLRWSVFCIITNNSVVKSTYGISLFESNASTALNNTLLGCGFSVSGDTIPGCRQTSVGNNSVNGQPLAYWQDRVGGTVDAGAGQVILVNCTGVVIKDQVLVNCTIGIQLSYCNGSWLTNNNCSLNEEGISLRLSQANILSANLLSRNHEGIFLYKSRDNAITRQICTKNDIGIRLAWWSSNNIIANNTCTENWQGIVLEYQSSANRIVRNILAANVYNAYDTVGNNVFDFNYWSDYWGFDLNQDGFGDIPYIVPPGLVGSFDPHPLMSPPGTPPTFGPREAFWLAVFLTPVVGAALLVGTLAWFHRRRRERQEIAVERVRRRRPASR